MSEQKQHRFRRRARGQPRSADAPSDRVEGSRVRQRSVAVQGAGARLRHLPRLPPLLQPVQLVPDAVRCGGRIVHRRSRRRRQEGLLGGRRPLLPVRHVLHDQVSVRAAASLERRLPALDAASQGIQVQSRNRKARSRSRARDKILSSTDLVGSIAGIPVIAEAVNAINKTELGRKVLDRTLGVHPKAPIPEYHSNTYRKRHAAKEHPQLEAQPAGDTRGKVVLFATCYGNRNEPRAQRRSRRRLRTQRHRRHHRVARALLWHAEAGTRRSRSDRAAEEREHSRNSRNGWTRAGTSSRRCLRAR